MDALATFLLLSYVKILRVSMDLFIPVVLYNENGQPLSQLYLFNQGDMAYFSSQHLRALCLSGFILSHYLQSPTSVAAVHLSLFTCFQVCLNHTGFSCQSLHHRHGLLPGTLQIGTNGIHDFQYFLALSLLFTIVVYVSLMFAYQVGSYASTTIIVVCFTAIVARSHTI